MMAVSSGAQVVLEILCLLSTILFFAVEAHIEAEWSWESGSDMVDQLSLNSSDKSCPGGRKQATGWADGHGGLWLYGGSGKGFKEDWSSAPYITLDDLWRFDIASKNWTFIESGSQQQHGESSKKHYPPALAMAVSCSFLVDKAVMFGGSHGDDGVSSQTWVWDLSTHEWTSLDSTISPPGREESAVWCTKTEMWIFGGYRANNYQQDMWKFSVDSLTWEKQDIKGDLPPARGGAVTWVSEGEVFYLFGGQANRDFFSDMWLFSSTEKKWTNIFQGVVNTNGVYGTCNASFHQSFPGSRAGSASWTDVINDNLWLFGGIGYDIHDSVTEYLSDLWMFDTSHSCWSWMGGLKKGEMRPHYSKHYGQKNATNLPGPRSHGVSWTTEEGLFLFGGVGHDNYSSDGHLNDLWQLHLEFTLKEPAKPEHPLHGNTVDLSMSTRIAVSFAVLFFALAFTILVCYNRGNPRKRLKERSIGTKIKYERVTDSVESIDIHTAA